MKEIHKNRRNNSRCKFSKCLLFWRLDPDAAGLCEFATTYFWIYFFLAVQFY